MTEKQQTAAAKAFAKRWSGHGYEKGETQMFWSDLLRTVFDSEKTKLDIEYEKPVKKGKGETQYIDAYIPATRVLIEQKGSDIDLSKHQQRKDKIPVTPYGQAKQYADNLPYSEKPRWIITCNFREIWVYDMDKVLPQPDKIMLSNLGKEWHRLRFLADTGKGMLSKEVQVSIKAGQLVGEIYDALLKQYDVPTDATLRWLNILCVRLVFCLYAEDAGIFRRDLFHDYLINCNTADMRRAIIDLFKTLNTPEDKRSPYLGKHLAAFPYANGGLFAEEIDVPQFTDEIKSLLIKHASSDFDWSEISPTIFGAVFESTLNPETRRSGGMHYTSIENIHKVIDPLFLDSLRLEMEKALGAKEKRSDKLRAFQNKLASLTFLDPACGSGNFLTETYLSLRRMENRVIQALYGEGILGSVHNPVKVGIHQFYGIEINDFAVTVATTALWISEAQMLSETERIVQHDINFLPLKSNTNIREGNALRMDWETLTSTEPIDFVYTDKLNIYQTDDIESSLTLSEPTTPYGKAQKEMNVVARQVEYKDISELKRQTASPITYDYIIGNPPFVGRRYRSSEQTEDIKRFFAYKDIDYVACWFKKAAALIRGTHTRCAFVATNSITQGEQVAALWNGLNVNIDFAYQTFRWNSESDSKAHVHCVIIGFSSESMPSHEERTIYSNGLRIAAKNINGYLIDAPNVHIRPRSFALCNGTPQMCNGNVPLDGDALKVEAEELVHFSECSHLIKRLIGGRELLYNEPRYVIWLVGVSPAEIKKYPRIYKRVAKCRENRLSMKDPGSRRLAESPTTFRDTLNPENYVALPLVSSERRSYVPMAYFHGDTIPTNQVQIIPSATLYHFGVLESSVHMAWMRAVCGRLKSDYRYSKDIVYNNFPWPTPTEAQQAKIEQTAQAILDARALYPDSSLAALYDDLTMPAELHRAHLENDRAVMQAYGLKPRMTENDIVAFLFSLYHDMDTL